MAAHTFGGEVCRDIKGRIPRSRKQTKFWGVEGFNYYAMKTGGKRSGTFTLDLTNIDTKANINTWLAAIEDMQGTVVSVIDAFEDTYTNVGVINVTQTYKRKCIEDGTSKVIAKLRAVCVRTGA